MDRGSFFRAAAEARLFPSFPPTVASSPPIPVTEGVTVRPQRAKPVYVLHDTEGHLLFGLNVLDAAGGRIRFAGAVSVFLLAGLACSESDSLNRGTSLTAAFSDEGVPRLIRPRLSVETRYADCLDTAQVNTALETVDCRTDGEAPLPSTATLGIVQRAVSSLERALDPQAAQVAGISDLLWGERSGKSLDRSISYLRMASRFDRTRAAALTDLSAALIVRAWRNQDFRDLFDAMESAEAAVAQQPAGTAARFNLALTLEMSGLNDQARVAWGQYLKRDSVSGWSREARRRRQRIDSATRQLPKEPQDSTHAALMLFATRSPQEARLYGWNDLLGAWGESFQRDSRTASTSLDKARVIANALVQRGGDATLLDAVSAIEKQGSTHGRKKLADAHATFAAAHKKYAAAEYAVSSTLFRSAAAESQRSPVLRAWSEIFLGATLLYAGEPANAERLIGGALARTDPGRHAALAGRASWMLGTIHLRSGLYERAREDFRRAAKFFNGCGEREYAGAVQALAAESDFKLGDATNGYVNGVRTLYELRPFRGSVWVHNMLGALGAAALTDGFNGAAFRIYSEGVSAAAAIGQPIYLAEARLARARTPQRTARDASVDIDAADSIIRHLPPGLARRWFSADLAVTRSLVAPPGRRGVQRVELDSAVLVFESLRNSLRLLPAVLARADASLDDRDPAAALADLTRAAAILESEHDSIASAALRLSILTSARRVFERAVALSASSGDTVGSLRLLEKSRGTFTASHGGNTGDERSLEAPKGTLAVEYMIANDTLFVWTVSGRKVSLFRNPLRGFALVETVSRTIELLEGNAPDNAIQPALARLHRELIGPIDSVLVRHRGSPILFVGDDWVAATPFAALKGAHGRYLIEDHPVSLISHLASPRVAERNIGVEGVLLVGDPSFDKKRHRALERLPESRAEVTQVASIYPGASVLSGDRATYVSVSKALPRASVVHYAGHAIADRFRPAQSFLPLAPASSDDSAGVLKAENIEALDLRNVRLVVLSACETIRPVLGSYRGANGLMVAFLSAGAHGVVGSLWRVDDVATRTLMTGFHADYKANRDAVGALRRAQLRMIGSSEPTMRSPFAWSAFQYVSQ